MDKKSLLERITESLKKLEWMSKYASSQFVTMLANIGWQIIRTAKSESENAIPEINLSTAIKRSSILAAAEDRGYVGAFITPSHGTCKIKNNSNTLLKLQVGTVFLSNAQNPYMLDKTVSIAPNSEISGVKLKQQEKVIIEYDVEKETEFLEIILDQSISSELASIDVYVIIDGTREKWNRNQNFRLSRNTSKDYHLSYKPTEQYAIRFGDGAIGMMPPEKSTVVIEVMASMGVLTLIEGQTLTPIGTAAKYAQLIQVKTETPITNGAGQEDIEITRQNALYYTAYDNQIIWGGDYAYFIKTNIPDIRWINVWGEEEQERVTGFDVKNINNIFICAHKEGMSQSQLHAEIEAVLKSAKMGLNLTPRYVDKNDLPYTITLQGKCEKYLDIDEVIEDIKAALNEPFGENASDYSASIDSTYYENVKTDKIYERINALGLLTDFEVVIDNPVKAEQLNDFVYLDVNNSTFDISIKGENNG